MTWNEVGRYQEQSNRGLDTMIRSYHFYPIIDGKPLKNFEDTLHNCRSLHKYYLSSMVNHSSSNVKDWTWKIFGKEQQLFSRMSFVWLGAHVDHSSQSLSPLGVAMYPYSSLRNVCKSELCYRLIKTSHVLGFTRFPLLADWVETFKTRSWRY